MHFGMDFWSVFSMVFLVTAIPVAIMIILEKRSPYKTAAWVLALILLPVFGVFFYLFFGQEYRKQKLFSRKGLKSLTRYRRLSFRQLRQFEQSLQNIDPKVREKENIIRLLLKNSNALLTTGNKVKILNNADETFSSIFEAIETAVHHIHLEYYILSNDKTGNRLKNLLIKKSRQGVEVRIIIDDVGSWSLGNKFMSELRDNGIEIYSFMEVRFPRLTSRVNYRNHRKIVVVDGRTGFTGGINFADRYLEGAKGIGPWRDTHLRIEGDAVSCLQVVFAADWFFVIHENLTGQKYFPLLSEEKGVPMQISASGPDSDWASIDQAFFKAIAGAKSKIYIASPYLMPPPEIIFALKTAALGNVDVRILIPEKSDAAIPMWSSFSYIEELLEAGVRIFFYQAGFIHSKYLIVDDIFCSVGTTNLDFRSLETNFEVNAFIYDEEFTAGLKKYFLSDLQNSREIKLPEWKQRSWIFKLRESLAHIVSPML
ncbi:cardiolipin synthase [Mariniphaga sediminis]|uniref:Cardiolipin synthase n=1 Tax=Mariniphaga sediminis TaxID=1628158 RepID=A0A399D7Y1_9BACT|nr:cardiolipin synthase [Mariniphaga sediminis]RIH66420.1 cardiolipin synthase [Mariniphaga sediminis]